MTHESIWRSHSICPDCAGRGTVRSCCCADMLAGCACEHPRTKCSRCSGTRFVMADLQGGAVEDTPKNSVVSEESSPEGRNWTKDFQEWEALLSEADGLPVGKLMLRELNFLKNARRSQLGRLDVLRPIVEKMRSGVS